MPRSYKKVNNNKYFNDSLVNFLILCVRYVMIITLSDWYKYDLQTHTTGTWQHALYKRTNYHQKTKWRLIICGQKIKIYNILEFNLQRIFAGCNINKACISEERICQKNAQGVISTCLRVKVVKIQVQCWRMSLHTISSTALPAPRSKRVMNKCTIYMFKE